MAVTADIFRLGLDSDAGRCSEISVEPHDVRLAQVLWPWLGRVSSRQGEACGDLCPVPAPPRGVTLSSEHDRD